MAAFASVIGLRAGVFRGGYAVRNVCAFRSHKVLFKPHEQAHMVRMMCATSGAPDTVMETVKRKLSDALSPERLTVTPTYGDPNGSHVSIEVVSNAFEGLNVVKRHQAVYKVIWNELQVGDILPLKPHIIIASHSLCFTNIPNYCTGSDSRSRPARYQDSKRRCLAGKHATKKHFCLGRACEMDLFDENHHEPFRLHVQNSWLASGEEQ